MSEIKVETTTTTDDYITVVEVDDGTPKSPHITRPVKRQNSVQEDSSYITVLTINNGTHNDQTTNEKTTNVERLAVTSTDQNQTANMEHEITVVQNFNATDTTEAVTVYRLPGERLGFGLKFQGGTRNTERVQKLYIQSCAKDSPASKVVASWGALREGDEIVTIDDRPVREMTRIECVRCLKDNVAIRLEVRNGHGQKPDTKEEHLDAEYFGGNGLNNHNTLNGGTILLGTGQAKLGQPPPPPPVPPRKLIKRKSLKEHVPVIAVNKTHDANSSNANVTTDKPFTPPPDAEYYINLFADNQSIRAESESDDTASTISTVIDKFSICSSYSSESDLSSFASLTNGQNVMNKSELVKVLKPFTMLEQEFKVTQSFINDANANKQPQVQTVTKCIPGNNYENVEFKTEKINVYENYEFKPNGEKVKNEAGPTPKPRQVMSIVDTTSTFTGNSTASPTSTTPTTPPTPPLSQKTILGEVKKRSIIPMPRKTGGTSKMLIEVTPPKVPSIVEVKTPTPTPTTTHTPTETTTEFVTKIPKAIGVSSPNNNNLQRLPERAKTEGEIVVGAPNSLKKVTALFIEQESKTEKPAGVKVKSEKVTPVKSRIPVVLTPKRSLDSSEQIERKSPSTSSYIPRIIMQKQKSETDLKLGLSRSKSKELSPTQSKLPLQRTLSVESKLRSPDRTLIPVLSGSMSSSTESLHSVHSLTNGAGSTSNKIKGPKPKPPERVTSLPKTQIPKLQTLVNNSIPVQPNGSVTSTNKVPTLQTFKQSPPANKANSPVPIAQNGKTNEIRFKIQTYESKVQQLDNGLPYVDVTDNADVNVPSLYDLVRKTSPETQRKEDTSAKSLVLAVAPEQSAVAPTSNAVGKCFKVTNEQHTYYSSSSSEEEEEDDLDNEAEPDLNMIDIEKDYDCEDGEKLGPPEVINGPGPSEAYFNLYWHSNVLPTIGEVEEEGSSIEFQHLNTG